MNALALALEKHAAAAPEKIALQDGTRQLSYGELDTRVRALMQTLALRRPRVIGLLADNSCDWAIVDLAAHRLQIPIVPLPIFFSASQLSHIVHTAGIDLIVTDRPTSIMHLAWRSCDINPICSDFRDIWIRAADHIELPTDVWKITFTSGSTGDPKGVCLSRAMIDTAAEQLCLASAATNTDRHLCMLPLSTLLENIGGLYAALLAGATISLPSMRELGITGSSNLQPAQFLAALRSWRPTTGILVPQLLQALVAMTRAGAQLPRTMRYLAVGGAPIAASTLNLARELGLPVYEGYGLSECASVVTLNIEAAQRHGSVGKPLPHVQVRIADDGEIIVTGLPWYGYLGDDHNGNGTDEIATGDIGYLDDDGFLFITGRKKNLFVTAFGRNVAPEWIERELVAQVPIQQAAVFGEGRACNCAVIVASAAMHTEIIANAVHAANSTLPDYAHIKYWLLAAEPFSLNNGQATANGRLRRDRIFERYAHDIDALYADRVEHNEFLSGFTAADCTR